MGDKFRNKIKRLQRNEDKKFRDYIIPPQVAIVKRSEDISCYRLNFSFYNHNQCELKQVQNFKPLIKKLDWITRSTFATLSVRDKLSNVGHYQNLFNGLPQDVDDLEEISYTDAGRIIFFRASNMFYLVSVLAVHR